MGVRMGTVFQIAKDHAAMEPGEIEVLLDSPVHEARAAAVKVMALQAAARATAESRRTELYELYLRRTTGSTTGTSSTSAAADVSVATCSTAPRPAYELARSPDLWRRRTAIWATLHFLRQGQVDDTYAIVELVLDDHRDSRTRRPARCCARRAWRTGPGWWRSRRPPGGAVAHRAADRHRGPPARRARPLRQAAAGTSS